MPGIHSLPQELVVMTLGFCDRIEDLQRMQLVCKEWKSRYPLVSQEFVKNALPILHPKILTYYRRYQHVPKERRAELIWVLTLDLYAKVVRTPAQDSSWRGISLPAAMEHIRVSEKCVENMSLKRVLSSRRWRLNEGELKLSFSTLLNAAFGGGVNLVYIDLSNLPISVIPQEIIRLPQLQVLNLEHCRFTYIPYEQLFAIEALRVVYMKGNPIPPEGQLRLRCAHPQYTVCFW
ncbi:MAG: hypothetical protein S4CHLAM102_16330 [Chlamydiia bacterium]|nr:hypothetical protein [Chlamydiia bacterium]